LMQSSAVQRSWTRTRAPGLLQFHQCETGKFFVRSAAMRVCRRVNMHSGQGRCLDGFHDVRFAGAAIGSAAALVSASLASFVALHNERKRREEAARASAVRSLRTAAAAAFTAFYNFSHAISWITWYAKHVPVSVDAQMASLYEQENHAVIPKLQGALAVLASLSLTVYEELQPLVHRLFVLDKHVSTAVVRLRDDRGRRDRLFGNAAR